MVERWQRGSHCLFVFTLQYTEKSQCQSSRDVPDCLTVSGKIFFGLVKIKFMHNLIILPDTVRHFFNNFRELCCGCLQEKTHIKLLLKAFTFLDSSTRNTVEYVCFFLSSYAVARIAFHKTTFNWFIV